MLIASTPAALTLLSEILRNAGDAVVAVDAHYRIVLFNRQAEEVFGWPAAEMLGQSLDRLLPAAAVAAHRQHVADFARGTVASRLMGGRRAIRGRRRDGSEFPAEVSIARAGSGEDMVMIAVLRDISHQRREEERVQSLNGQLLALTGQLQTVLAHTAQGIACYDAELRLVVWNRRFQDIYVLPDEAMQWGTPAARMLSHAGMISGVGGIDPDRTIASRMRTLARPERLTMRRRLPDGRLIEITQVPLPDGGRMTTHTDITEHDRRESELRLARDRAEAADRFRAELIANVTHELRTPFNAIIGFAGLLREAGPQTEPALVREYARYIEDAARGLLGSIDRILELSTAGTGPLQLQEAPVALGEILQEACLRWRPAAAEAGVTLRCDTAAELPVLLLDAGRMGEALDCLLSNAIRFGSSGVGVALSGSMAEGAPEIVVSDDGPGMPPERLAEVMQPFRQLDQSASRRQGGLGLGLPLAKRLVEAHGGSLALASRPGGGTRACIRLPGNRVLGAVSQVCADREGQVGS